LTGDFFKPLRPPFPRDDLITHSAVACFLSAGRGL